MSTVKTIKNEAKRFLTQEWIGHEKVCPAFNEKVYVTRLFWEHLFYHKRRVLVDLLIRLKKLPLAKGVLETSTTYQTKQKRGKYVLYGFRAVIEDTIVKIVVSSKGEKGKKLLYSVMFKSMNRQEQKRIEEHNRKIIAEFKRKNPRPRIKSRRK